MLAMSSPIAPTPKSCTIDSTVFPSSQSKLLKGFVFYGKVEYMSLLQKHWLVIGVIAALAALQLLLAVFWQLAH